MLTKIENKYKINKMSTSFYNESINLMFKYKGSLLFILIIIICKNLYFYFLF